MYAQPGRPDCGREFSADNITQRAQSTARRVYAPAARRGVCVCACVSVCVGGVTDQAHVGVGAQARDGAAEHAHGLTRALDLPLLGGLALEGLYHLRECG